MKHPLQNEFTQAGFAFEQAGGGFERWVKPAGRHALLSVSAWGELPSRLSEPVMFSVLSMDGADDVTFTMTAGEALALSGKLAS